MLMVSLVTAFCLSTLRSSAQVTKAKNSSHEIELIRYSRGLGAKSIASRSAIASTASAHPDDASPPSLGQEDLSFAHQLVDLDGVEGDEHQDRRTRY